MADYSREEIEQLEESAFERGRRSVKKSKVSKRKATNTLVFVIAALFVVTYIFSWLAWALTGNYPAELTEGITKVLLVMGGGAVVKSGAENFGKITHAEEYNRNYPDA